MQTSFLQQPLTYDGTQLRSHFIFDTTGHIGDGIISFIGPANVTLEHMVDLLDVRDHAHIYSPNMLHFICEHFSYDLSMSICLQRLLIVIASETITSLSSECPILRKGDDLFINDKKLSVSIATKTPVSTCIHFAMNIHTDNTPVPTYGLGDLDIDINKLAMQIMKNYIAEVNNMHLAKCKVRITN